MAMNERNAATGKSASWAVVFLKICSVALAIVLLNVTVSWGIGALETQIWPEHLETLDRVVVIGMIVYTCLMALPFVPGVEIGLTFMMMLGPKGIVVVYVCTLIALAIGFGLGRLFPVRQLAAFLRWLHLTRAEALLKKFDAIAPEARLAYLVQHSSARTAPALLRHRYALLALLLNLPGNAVIGGGGGIAVIAGMCRLYPFPNYLGLIALAILPGPLLIMLSDRLH